MSLSFFTADQEGNRCLSKQRRGLGWKSETMAGMLFSRLLVSKFRNSNASVEEE